MTRKISLDKVSDTNPQEYQLKVRDLEDDKVAYKGRLERGTEAEIRSLLIQGHMDERRIDELFANAKWM